MMPFSVWPFNRYLSSLHTHTVFCDGRDDVQTMCRAAFEQGLRAVGFSAHAPVSRQLGETGWHLPEDRVAEYIETVRSARRHWEGRLVVLLALEVDYLKGLRSALDRDIRALELDYIIGSVHYVVPQKGKIFAVDGPPEELENGIRESFGGDGEALMHAYWDAVAEMTALGGFDILGHADLVKRNNQDGRWFNMESPAYIRRLEETARLVSGAGLAVEVNTGGLNRKRTSDTYPSLPFIHLLKENHVPLLITADAHCSEDIAGNYETAFATLRKAGFSEQEILGQNDTVLSRIMDGGSK